MCKLIALVLVSASLLMAQGRKGGNNNPDMMGAPAMARPEPLDQLANMLKLNKDQKRDLKAILDETQKEVTPLRDSMVKSREQIGAAIEAGKSQADIDQALKSYADLEAQVSGAEAKAFSKMFAGLDGDQKANPQTLVNSLMFLHEIFKRRNWNSTSAE